MSLTSDELDPLRREVFIRFLEELDEAPHPAEVVERYQAAHPEWACEFDEMAGLRGDLGAAAPSIVSSAWAPGSAVAIPDRIGPYRVVGIIGSGGMGVVYEAEEEPLGRRVAVKTVRRGRSASAGLKPRFEHERRTLARLHHTNIVPIYAAGGEGGVEYFAMPYLVGATLKLVLRTARALRSSESGLVSSSFKELVVEAHSQERSENESAAPVANAKLAALTRPGGHGRLSKEYLRSVAQVIAGVADGIEHAHQEGIFHRDLTPSNILVATNETPWILDFGLAPEPAGLSSADGSIAGSPRPGSARSEGEMVGTPGYMAPEQCTPGGTIDRRTDVWGLGVILYELITLRQAFPSTGDWMKETREKSPQRPRSIAKDVSRDLEAICLKAIQKAPESRYATAAAMAADLRRWLKDEPVDARPAGWLRRALLWTRRNRGLAGSLAGLFLTVVLAVSVWVHERIVTAEAATKDARNRVILAQEREQAASVRTEAALAAERIERREVHIQKAERIRLSAHEVRWSRAAWLQIEQAAAIAAGTADGGNLQSAAIGSLRGLDAIPVRQFHDFGASSLAFDATGKRLLMGGVTQVDNANIPLPARIWTADANTASEIPFDKAGPVGFRPDGAPIQLVADEKSNALILYDLSTIRPIHSFAIPGKLDLAPHEDAFSAMASDGSLVAAPVRDGDRRGLAVWDGASGRLLHVFPGRTHSVAFSNDGSLTARGLGDGRVVVHTTTTGVVVADVRHGELPVYALSLAPDYHRGKGDDPGPHADGRGWLLAAGGQGGYVSIWELGTRKLRARCVGAIYDIYSVAFSPDATLVASCGRDFARVWNVATSNELLQASTGSYAYAVIFSRVGRSLAIASERKQPGSGRVEIFNLEEGRGLQVLRGLFGTLEKAVFSRDGRYVAALSMAWEVAIWDRETGALRHVLTVPRGPFTDNAALAFSPDGRRLAVSAGETASLWDLESGRKLQTWKLPPGLNDRIAFRGPEEIVLVRMETGAGIPPFSEFPSVEYPRVIPIRRLYPGKKDAETLKTLTEYAYTAALELAPDGSACVVSGRRVKDLSSSRTVLIDALTGSTLREFEAGYHREARFSSSGSLLELPARTAGGTSVTDVWSYPKLERQSRIEQSVLSIAPDGDTWVEVRHEGGADNTCLFVDRKSGRTLARIRLDHIIVRPGDFSPDSRHQFVWADSEGSVVLCDLPRIRDRLNEIGVGW